MNLVRSFGKLAIIIFVVETIVMIGLNALSLGEHHILEMFLDSTALLLLSSPFIFYWVIIPQLREDRARQAKIAEARDEAKSNFLAAMSHEIRTPMNGIIGLVDIVLNSDLEENQRDHLNMAHQSAVSLMVILNDILDVSKIEAGEMGLETAPFSMKQALEETVSLWQSIIKSKGLEFDVSISPDIADMVIGDKRRLSQVFSNLLSNAVKFTESGTISLVARSTKQGGQACFEFEIADTGIGLQFDQQVRIFNRFTQADQSTSRKYGGSGLGLAITKALVRMMGGTIDVQSQPDKGSTFHFEILCEPTSLPAAEYNDSSPIIAQVHDKLGEEDKNKTPAPARDDDGKIHILVAEDHEINCTLVEAILRNEGYHVTFANNGAVAVEKASRGKFDVILMDIHMPVMDGLTALQRIRASNGLSATTPVVALSACAMVGDRERFLEGGMDDHISKPLDSKLLIETIERLAPQKTAKAS